MFDVRERFVLVLCSCCSHLSDRSFLVGSSNVGDTTTGCTNDFGCQGICYSFKKLKLASASTKFNTNGPVLLFKAMFRHWNFFVSSVAKDSKDRHGLKVLVLRLHKSPKNIVLDLVLMYGLRHYVMTWAQTWPKKEQYPYDMASLNNPFPSGGKNRYEGRRHTPGLTLRFISNSRAGFTSRCNDLNRSH